MQQPEIITIQNDLFDWSLDNSEISSNLRFNHDGSYSWKLPMPSGYLDISDPSYRGLQSFCISRLVAKMLMFSKHWREFQPNKEVFNFYVLVSMPNLFMSEVGVTFSKQKWDELIFRNVNSNGYLEKTECTPRSFFSDFGIILPSSISTMYLNHTIEDVKDELSFSGGYYALWME
jgi:hypothetical protein